MSIYSINYGYYYGKCVGCERKEAVNLDNFPEDYPKDKMLCCACASSYYHHVGIPKPSNICSYAEYFNIMWWDIYGKGIEKVMRLQ